MHGFVLLRGNFKEIQHIYAVGLINLYKAGFHRAGPRVIVTCLGDILTNDHGSMPTLVVGLVWQTCVMYNMVKNTDLSGTCRLYMYSEVYVVMYVSLYVKYNVVAGIICALENCHN